MQNKYIIIGKTVVIFINRKDGKMLRAYIDKEDLPLLKSYDVKWYALKDKTVKKREKYYVGAIVDGTTILLHRFLMGFPKNLVVDHVDGNPLNNRRSNLRLLTLSQNALNRKEAGLRSKSGVLGVCWNKRRKKWRARVNKNGKIFYEKHFDDLEEAKMAVEEARKRAFEMDNLALTK